MKNLPLSTLPHSWSINKWPATVWPGSPSRGRYAVHANRAELIACGAIVRVRKDLIILGPNFAGWLARKADRVHGYSIAPNRARVTGMPAGGPPAVA